MLGSKSQSRHGWATCKRDLCSYLFFTWSPTYIIIQAHIFTQPPEFTCKKYIAQIKSFYSTFMQTSYDSRVPCSEFIMKSPELSGSKELERIYPEEKSMQGIGSILKQLKVSRGGRIWLIMLLQKVEKRQWVKV